MNDLPQAERYADLREGVRAACEVFGPDYWRRIDAEKAYPDEFVQTMTLGGWLSALIPTEYGGSGLGVAETSVIVEEINRSGGDASACLGQMFAVPMLLRHGTEEHRKRWLPRLATGEVRLQSVAVTEAASGSDASGVETTATFKTGVAGGRWVINGRKPWASRVLHSDGMLILARTTPRDQVARATDGLSFFLVQVQQAVGEGMTARPIPNMGNHEVYDVTFDNLELSASLLIGEEGQGFRYLLEGVACECAIVAAQCIGDAYWFIDKARRYANERVVFGRPIGKNQGIQFPLAQAYIETQAADLMRFKACDLFDARKPCGPESNMAKYLAAKAAWECADACLQTHGGFGFAVDYDVERKFRTTRVYQVAPMPTNQIFSYVAEHELGLPRSF